MSTLHQVREGLNEAWESVVEGWQKLYRRAAGALTRFTPGRKSDADAQDSREIAIRSTGWGFLAAELFDDADRVVIRLEAPGMERDDFDIEVLDDYLVVRGEKHIERNRTEGRYHVMECAYGSFERAFPLPEEVQADQASASYDKGVLKIELPKAAQQRRKTIKVDID